MQVLYTNDNTTRQVNKIKEVSAQYGLCQIRSIHLKFTSQQNFIAEFSIPFLSHPNCHHQIIFAKLHFKICYPLRYKTTIWHDNRAENKLLEKQMNTLTGKSFL